MRRVVHISDLHFGRARPELLDPLVDCIAEAAPDLVIVSGDFTQRARQAQFKAARGFLDRLTAPWLAVPGNHDVPLYNLPVRLLHPYRGYRRWISNDLEPLFSDDEIAVVAVNTVDPRAWQRGKIGKSAIRRARARLGPPDPSRMRIVVVHHPFSHLPNEPKELMDGAEEGIAALTEARVDIVLSGHLHAWRVEPVATRLEGSHTIQVQAGTGLSTRQRGEENDFNLLTINGTRLIVERFAAADNEPAFVPVAKRSFARVNDQWVSAEA
jgi:3',5'-cyclic AMP phosphodiesterase CpdA